MNLKHLQYWPRPSVSSCFRRALCGRHMATVWHPVSAESVWSHVCLEHLSGQPRKVRATSRALHDLAIRSSDALGICRRGQIQSVPGSGYGRREGRMRRNGRRIRGSKQNWGKRVSIRCIINRRLYGHARNENNRHKGLFIYQKNQDSCFLQHVSGHTDFLDADWLVGARPCDHQHAPTRYVLKKKKVLFKIILSWHRDASLFSTFGYLLFSIFVSTMESNYYTGEVVMAPLCRFVSVLWFEIKEKGPVPFIAWGCGQLR